VSSSDLTAPRVPRPRPARVALHLLLGAVALVWLFPVLWAAYASLRPFADTAADGYVSLPATLTFDNYVRVWQTAELPRYLANTLIVAIPATILVLALAVAAAFGLSRCGRRLNLTLLMFFIAGNLLPPHAIIIPLYRLYLALPIPAPLSDNGVLYDQPIGLIAIHVAFQVGFCAFVLSNYLRTVPRDLLEAALIEGASIAQTLRRVVVPLCRPAIAALAALEFTWIYNDLLWALIVMRTATKRPITSALEGLRGEFFTDANLLAAGAILAALPTLIVFLGLYRHVIRGLALGQARY
jgi:multiple sugar transport system permease protein